MNGPSPIIGGKCRHVDKLVVSMVGTHPSLPRFSIYGFLVWRTGEWRINAIQVPPKIAIVTWHNLSLAVS